MIWPAQLAGQAICCTCTTAYGCGVSVQAQRCSASCSDVPQTTTNNKYTSEAIPLTSELDAQQALAAHQSISIDVGPKALILASHRGVVAAPELAVEQLQHNQARTVLYMQIRQA